jgi:hypothetical protein
VVANGQPKPFSSHMSSVDSRLSTVFFEAITGFLHLNSSLLMLTKVEVLQASENLRNHSAGPMIFAGSMRYGGMLRKGAEQADRSFRSGRPTKWDLAAIVDWPSWT